MQHCPYLITDGDTDTDQTCDDADTDAVRQVHNYGSMTYVPELDEMCNIGRSALSATAGSSYSNDLICWAFDTKTWVVHNDAYGWGISAAATVERDTGKVWSSGASSAGDKAFASWVPSTDTWTQHIANNSKIFGAFIAIDETNDYLVEVGGGSGETHNCNTRGRDLSDPTDPISVLTASTPGGTPSDPGMCCCPVAVCVGGSNDGNPCCDDEDCPGGDPVDNCDGCGWESQEYMPGFAWDPTIGKNVGWNLTGTVYTFEDPGGTNTWNTVTHNGATVPAFTSGLGAAGKWWYSDQDNIFGASHQADHNVFLYRLNADPNGATPPVSNVEGAAVSGGSFE
jgi:hypothetical protein